MFPSKAKIFAREQDVQAAHHSAHHARQILRASIQEAVVSPLGLTAGVVTGFIAARSMLAGPHSVEQGNESRYARASRYFRWVLLALPLLSNREPAV